MGKKRRCEVDLDAERSMYTSFVAAANSISQLYTHAVQQQRKSSAAASRQGLERVLAFVLREHANADSIPKASLLQFLQQEYENVEGSEHLPHLFPVQFPMMHGGAAANNTAGSSEEASPDVLAAGKHHPLSSRQHLLVSPGARQRLQPGSLQFGIGSQAMDTAVDHQEMQPGTGPYGFGFTSG